MVMIKNINTIITLSLITFLIMVKLKVILRKFCLHLKKGNMDSLSTRAWSDPVRSNMVSELRFPLGSPINQPSLSVPLEEGPLTWWSLLLVHTSYHAKHEKEDTLRYGEFIRFDYVTIRSATENFLRSNIIGEGMFGVVYKGTLKSGKVIAIKRLGDLDLSTEVFMTESRGLARIQHTNLVKHLGFCSEGELKLLVYEFLPNASLDRLLIDRSKRILINWETWYKIILGTAKGLEYLHAGADPVMLHHRLKPSNVLLDEEMNPKIADFGMNWLYGSRKRHVNTCSTAIGTYAYIAPEYFYSGTYSEKSDVYSFGVLVLETLSDLKEEKSNRFYITDAHRTQVRKLWDEDQLSELINPALSNRCSEAEVIRCIQVGILCVAKDAEHRPTMTAVVPMLTGDVNIPLPLAPSI